MYTRDRLKCPISVLLLKKGSDRAHMKMANERHALATVMNYA